MFFLRQVEGNGTWRKLSHWLVGRSPEGYLENFMHTFNLGVALLTLPLPPMYSEPLATD